MAVTRPEAFDFVKTKSRPLARDYVNEAAPQIDKFVTIKPNSTEYLLDNVKQPSNTRSMEVLAEARRSQLVNKRKAEF